MRPHSLLAGVDGVKPGHGGDGHDDGGQDDAAGDDRVQQVLKGGGDGGLNEWARGGGGRGGGEGMRWVGRRSPDLSPRRRPAFRPFPSLLRPPFSHAYLRGQGGRHGGADRDSQGDGELLGDGPLLGAECFFREKREREGESGREPTRERAAPAAPALPIAGAVHGGGRPIC